MSSQIPQQSRLIQNKVSDQQPGATAKSPNRSVDSSASFHFAIINPGFRFEQQCQIWTPAAAACRLNRPI